MKKYIMFAYFHIVLQGRWSVSVYISLYRRPYLFFIYTCIFIDIFFLQVVNHVGRMSRGRRKLLVYGLVVGTLLLLAYKMRTCPEPEPQTMFMMPKDVSIPHILHHDITIPTIKIILNFQNCFTRKIITEWTLRFLLVIA